MTELDLMNEYLTQELNNIHAYSADWYMKTPKKGYEKEFEDAEIKVDLIKSIMEKL